MAINTKKYEKYRTSAINTFVSSYLRASVRMIQSIHPFVVDEFQACCSWPKAAIPQKLSNESWRAIEGPVARNW